MGATTRAAALNGQQWIDGIYPPVRLATYTIAILWRGMARSRQRLG
jgi:hypothetical protein